MRGAHSRRVTIGGDRNHRINVRCRFRYPPAAPRCGARSICSSLGAIFAIPPALLAYFKGPLESRFLQIYSWITFRVWVETLARLHNTINLVFVNITIAYASPRIALAWWTGLGSARRKRSRPCWSAKEAKAARCCPNSGFHRCVPRLQPTPFNRENGTCKTSP
jgi:hypothetical protein